MEDADAWAHHADSWLERDHRLMTEASGWRAVLQRADLQIWSRQTPDDPNLLFRWHLPALEAPADVVFEGFVHRLLDYHARWTREFVEGRVLETLSPRARVLHQRFDPGVPASRCATCAASRCSAKAPRT